MKRRDEPPRSPRRGPHDRALAVSAGGIAVSFDSSLADAAFVSSQRRFFRGFLGNPALPAASMRVLPLPMSPKMRIDPQLSAVLRERLGNVFRRFPRSGNVESAVRLSIDWTRLLAGSAPFEAELRSFASASEESAVFFPRPQGAVFMRPGRGTGTVFVNSSFPAPGRVAFFREAVYFCLSQAAPFKGGLVLHGSGAARQSKGYVFLGLSGAGKTTIARLTGGDALSDDGIVVRRSSRGFAVSAVPFMQRRSSAAARAAMAGVRAPLAGLFFLRKGGPHLAERRPSPEALGEILHNFIHFFRWFPDDGCKAAFGIARDLVAACGGSLLHFSKDAGFWDVIIPSKCGGKAR